jgi:hypothetical protein
MSRTRILSMSILVTALLMFTFVASAQEPTATPQTGLVYGVADITGDTDSFHGLPVTIEGTVDELVNVRMFVLGDNAVIGGGQVLVINNTGQEFPLALTASRPVRMTGVVYPSFDQGGLEQFPFGVTAASSGSDQTEATDMPSEPTATLEADATPQSTAIESQTSTTMSSSRVGFADAEMRSVLGNVIQERFANFTIIELNAIDTLIIDTAQ